MVGEGELTLEADVNDVGYRSARNRTDYDP